MKNELKKLEDFLSGRGLHSEASFLNKLIKTADDDDFVAGPSGYVAGVLRELGLDEEYYINTPGDPYDYVYVPQQKGGPKFIVTGGRANTRYFDSAGNAKRTVLITPGKPGYDNLIERLPDNLKPVEESPPQAQVSQAGEWKLGTWIQERNEDGIVTGYRSPEGMWTRKPRQMKQVRRQGSGYSETNIPHSQDTFHLALGSELGETLVANLGHRPLGTNNWVKKQ